MSLKRECLSSSLIVLRILRLRPAIPDIQREEEVSLFTKGIDETLFIFSQFTEREGESEMFFP